MADHDDLLDYEDEEQTEQVPATNGEVAPAKKEVKGTYVSIHSSGFRDFLLKPEILRAIIDCGFEHPSEVQHECIPQAVLGMDILCQAKSGMGKTAVFVLATLQQLELTENQVYVLVMCHTRELAFQISKEYERFSKYMPSVKVSVFFGGLPIQKDEEVLKNTTPHIVVGTPGRILALVKSKKLNLKNLKHFVLDECDKMLEQLDMRKDVQEIFRSTPHGKQVMMFSATLSKEIRPVCKKFMQDPMEVYVDDEAKLTLHGLQQHYVKLKENEKTKKLFELLDVLEFNQVVIFVKSVQRCVALAQLLTEQNFPDNWNQEDEPEEAGTFQKASEEVLQRRVVKAARRRLPASGDGSTKNVFDSFSGFKSTTASSTNSTSPFSFLAKQNSANSTITSGSSSLFSGKTPTTNGSTKISENGIGVSATSTSSNSSLSKDTKTMKSPSGNESTSPKRPAEYYAKLKGLNQSVAQWIKTHVDANPVCILTPIFRDYEKYLQEIEQKHGKDVDSPKTAEKKSDSSETKSDQKPQTSISTDKKQENFIFGGSNTKPSIQTESWKLDKSIFGSTSMASKSIFSSVEKTDNKSPFSATSTMISDKSSPFLSKPSVDTKKDEESKKSEEKTSSGLTFPKTSIESGTFSFGQSSSTSTASAGFSFGGGKPITFGAAVAKPQESEEKSGNNDEKEEEDDEPPKPDFKPVTEEGAIYEQKVKVFVKKDGNYSDRGIGTLFLKPAPNDKMQLIVRAVNTLGNLLLNTLLTDSIPVKRLNKTNIMLVCLPLPTAEPPPVATLLRVKTEEDADALFETLEKNKK